MRFVPVTPNYYYVPTYDPYVVYALPRRGSYVGTAIRFGPAVVVGAGFAPRGWTGVGFVWPQHTILVDRRPWVLTWANRQAYVRTYGSWSPGRAPRVSRS